MVKKTIILAAGSIALAATAEAQTILGFARAQGGFGTAQTKADINLECSLTGIQINPYIGIAGVDKEKWNIITDREFLLMLGNDHYRSVREENYDGHTLYYGTDIKTMFSSTHMLEGRFAGSNIRMDGTGNLLETYGGTSLVYNHQYKLPSRNADIYDGNIFYTYRLGRKGENIKVGYRINSKSATDNQDELYSDSNTDILTSLLYQQEAKEVKQSGTADWNRPLGKGQMLNVGFEYENRHITSRDHHDMKSHGLPPHIINNSMNYTTEIDYLTQTYIYHVAYSLQKGPVVANARVDLQHHDIRYYVKLDDVVPTARVTWKMSTAQSLTAQYGQRIIRPDFDRLNPFRRICAYREYSYGNLALRGMHVNVASLVYQHKKQDIDVKATLSNIFCNDGFNALWYEGIDKASNTLTRNYTWANEGQRRAWSFAPEFTWTPKMDTKLYAKGEIIWDKRIAEAINMDYEHWGATVELGGTYSLAYSLNINVHGRYSEGNTIDLYSHESRSFRLGGFIHKNIGKLDVKLAYDYSEYARTVIAQGVVVPGPVFYGWTGSEYRRPESRHNLTSTIAYSF